MLQLFMGAPLGIGSTLSSILSVLLIAVVVVLIIKITSKIIKTALYVFVCILLIWFVLGLLSGFGVVGSLANLPVIGFFFS